MDMFVVPIMYKWYQMEWLHVVHLVYTSFKYFKLKTFAYCLIEESII